MEETENRIQRNYKDTLFRMIFAEKGRLLGLYNAVNGTNYTDSDGLEIVTLENAIYMNMKNDLAFLLGCTLNLYEHQSTFSPNMPLRNLFYIAREFEGFINTKTLYSSKQILLPTPRFIVFYNGLEKNWSRTQLKLSDAYKQKLDVPELELIVTMININYGKNDELLDTCHTLWEYMMYVEKVRRYSAKMKIDKAVQRAVKESIEEDILRDFLMRYRAEAVQMSIFEYDEERELRLIREDEREIGREEGGIQILIEDNLEEHISEQRILEKLKRRFNLDEEEALDWISRVKVCC